MLKRTISLPQKISFFLFGPRQVGKSTLVKEQFTKHIWLVDLLLNETYFSYSKDPSLFRHEAVNKIKNEGIKTIFIDASNADFLDNEKHLKVVLDALESDLEDGQHYFTLP